MIKSWFKSWAENTTLLQKGLLVLLLLGMLAIWPVCLVWQEEYCTSGSESYQVSEPLLQGMSFTQKFTAESDWLISVEFAMDYQEEEPTEGMFTFEFLNVEGELIYEGLIPYGQIPRYTFFPISVEQKLKKGDVYQYRITNVDVTENCPAVVYTADASMHAHDNCGFLIGEEVMPGESLARYLWKKPYDGRTVLTIWGFMGSVIFVLYELVGKKTGRKEGTSQAE